METFSTNKSYWHHLIKFLGHMKFTNVKSSKHVWHNNIQ